MTGAAEPPDTAGASAAEPPDGAGIGAAEPDGCRRRDRRIHPHPDGAVIGAVGQA